MNLAGDEGTSMNLASDERTGMNLISESKAFICIRNRSA